MRDLISEYRVHLVGLACLAILVRYWRAGELTDLSFWILGVDCAINLAIWSALRYGFAIWHSDPDRQRLADIAAETQFLSDKKRQGRTA